MREPQAERCPAMTARTADGGADAGAIVLRDLAPAGALFAAGLIGLAVAWALGAPRTGAWLVVAPPGSSFAETVEMVGAAQGGLIDAGRFGNIVIAASAEDGFADRLRAAGAWIVVPAPVAPACFDATIAVAGPVQSAGQGPVQGPVRVWGRVQGQTS